MIWIAKILKNMWLKYNLGLSHCWWMIFNPRRLMPIIFSTIVGQCKEILLPARFVLPSPFMTLIWLATLMFPVTTVLELCWKLMLSLLLLLLLLKQKGALNSNLNQAVVVNQGLTGPSPASFSFIFTLFNQTLQFLQQKMWKMSIQYVQCWDSNTRPSSFPPPHNH